MGRLRRLLMTQTGLRVSLGLAALVVWGVTWASTLSVGGGPVAAASSATRTTPSPTPSETLIPALVLTPTPSPSVKPARSPQPSPSPTPSRTPTATPTGTPSPAPSPTQAGATPTCTVAYRLSDSWSNGFIAAVGIGNTGSTAWNGWTLAFAFSGNQRITGAWNGSVAQSGASVTVKNVSSDGSVQPGGSTGFGFQATYSGRNVNPTSFTLNGRSCTTD